ncbi:MAG TPA: hypothetical protein EYH03_02635 [Chromatiales bacterium]|nr:hypothetical protein [Chromatiales bacterium]
MKRLIHLLAPTLLFAATLSPSSADVLLLQAIQQAPPNNAQGIPRPRGGMTMQQVRQQFGNPAQEVAPVGEPPISRWVYSDYTVYFEHQYVLNTVVHPRR